MSYVTGSVERSPEGSRMAVRLAVMLVVGVLGLIAARPVEAAVCGDGIAEAPEQCDSGSQNGVFPNCCTTSCTVRAYSSCTVAGNLCTAPIGIASKDLRTPTDQFTDIVRARNKFRINTPFLNDAKIVFQSRALWNPAAPITGYRQYSLDTHYDRLIGYGLWMDNADYFPETQIPQFGDSYGRVGMHSSTPSVFPVTTGAIDGCALVHTSAYSQLDITGKDVTVEFVKGGTFTTPLSGWASCQIQPNTPNLPCGQYSCTAANLPAGTYQIWNATLSFDGTSYLFELAVPATNPHGAERTGPFLDPRGLFGFLSEFLEFGHHFQFYVWDMEVQRQGSSDWIAIKNFKQTYTIPSTHRSSGGRLAVYNGKPVLEFSNDGTETYYGLDNEFTIPDLAGSVPAPLPRVKLTQPTQWIYNDQSTLTVVAALDSVASSNVDVLLNVTGTAAAIAYINHNFANPTVLTIPQGSLTGSITFNVGGTFPGAADNVTIYVDRTCGAMTGAIPAQKITFPSFPRRPHVTQQYEFGVPGPFTNYDVFLTVDTIPSQNFSPLMQYNFAAGVGGKVGLRLFGGQKYADFTALDLSATVAANPDSVNCQRMSPTGVSGTSCSVAYNWVAGREYRLRLAPLAANNREWKTTILDMDTGVETEIGQIELADALPLTGFGGLQDDAQRPNGFGDWFASSNSCGTFSAAKVRWRGPYATDGRYNPTRAEVIYGSGSCPQSNGSSPGCPLFTSDFGGSTVRTVGEGTNVWSAAPCSSSTLTNDAFAAAKVISALPYGDEVNTVSATQAADDPTTSGTSCGASRHSASVWYKFTPSTTGTFRASAVGSGYDTILAVWTGTQGSLTQVACNHDNANNAGGESELDFGASAGTTYYVELAGFQSAGGGIGSVTLVPVSTCP
jgi:hypothetical protein